MNRLNPISKFRAILALVIRRILDRPGLSLLLVLGMTVAAALAMSIPLYSDGIYHRLLIEEIQASEATTMARALFDFVFHYNGGGYGTRTWDEVASLDAYLEQEAGRDLGLPHAPILRQVISQELLLLQDEAAPLPDAEETWTQFASVRGVEAHITLLEGKFPTTLLGDVDPTIDVLVSRTQAEQQGLQIGMRLVAVTPDGRTKIPLRVSGVWQANNATEDFWFIAPEVLEDRLLVSEAALRDGIGRYIEAPVYMAWWYLSADASKLHAGDVDAMIVRLHTLQERIEEHLPHTDMPWLPGEVLREYQRSVRVLTFMLMLYSLPVLALLLTFVVLIASLTVERRRNEIAVMRSRGVTAGQVIGLAMVEALILSAVAFLLSLPLSLLLAQALSGTRSFLNFGGGAGLNLSLTPPSLTLGLVVLAAAMASQVLPTRRAAQRTMVVYKQERARVGRKPGWQRRGLDVLLLIPAAYGAYLLRYEGSVAVLDPFQNKSPFENPLLFLVPALGALSVSLLCLRFLPVLLAVLSRGLARTRSVAMLGALRHLARAPAAYSTPLVLLVLTLSMATYTASLAGTLERDLRDRATYRVGADMMFLDIGEGGPDVSPSDFTGERQITIGAPTTWEGAWSFPPVWVYNDLPGARDAARVGRYPATLRDFNYYNGLFLGVDPSDFVRVAFWREDFARDSLSTLMTALSGTFDGVLVPCDMLDIRAIGDRVQLAVTPYQRTTSLEFTIVGCFDLFPTWYPEQAPGANPVPLFVGNLDYLFQETGQRYPYQVWLSLAPGLDFIDISNTPIGGVNRYRKGWGWDAPRLDIRTEQQTPQRQGIFGVLSLGFAAAALLSVLGFLLYLFFSFQRRFVEFGVLRAVGISTRHMWQTLACEIAFLLLLSGGLGTGLGVAVSRYFIPYIQVEVVGQQQIPPYVVAIDWRAAVGIYTLFAVLFAVGVGLLMGLLRRLRIFEALKLGESV